MCVSVLVCQKVGVISTIRHSAQAETLCLYLFTNPICFKAVANHTIYTLCITCEIVRGFISQA